MKHRIKYPDQIELKRLFMYYPESGILYNRISRGPNSKAGYETGYLHKQRGYRMVMIDGTNHLVHRIIWIWMEGYDPENDIDHEDRINDNNKWDNLRNISHSCNGKNCKMSKNNTSGVTGVHWNKINEKWMAQAKDNFKHIYLGTYDDFVDAVIARWNGEVKYGYADCTTTGAALWLKKHGYWPVPIS